MNEPLIIADFSFDSFGKLEEFEQNLMYLIMSDFSKSSDSDKESYFPTQYVSEFIKMLGIEGIRINSSLYSRGRNISSFNYEKCLPIGSKLYEIGDICFEAKGIALVNEKSLVHYKIEPYRLKQIDELIKGLAPLKRNEEN